MKKTCRFCTYVDSQVDSGGETYESACRKASTFYSMRCCCRRRPGGVPNDEDLEQDGLMKD